MLVILNKVSEVYYKICGNIRHGLLTGVSLFSVVTLYHSMGLYHIWKSRLLHNVDIDPQVKTASSLKKTK
jgi:hypothetical protein